MEKTFLTFASKKHQLLHPYPSETLVPQGFPKRTLKILTFLAPPLVIDFCFWYNIVVRWEIFHRTGFDSVCDCVDSRIPGSSIRMGSGVQNGKQSMPKGINDFWLSCEDFIFARLERFFWLFWKAYAFAGLKRFLEASGELCSFEAKLITGTKIFIGFQTHILYSFRIPMCVFCFLRSFFLCLLNSDNLLKIWAR